MRSRTALLVIIALALAGSASAGNLKTLDFSGQENILALLGARDAVRFPFLGKDHQLMVRSIDVPKQRIEITLFIEGAETPFYHRLTPRTALNVDFNKDDLNDLRITPQEIKQGLVLLYFEPLSPSAQAPAAPTSPAFFSSVQAVLAGMSWTALALFVLALGLLYWRRRLLIRISRKLKRLLR